MQMTLAVIVVLVWIVLAGLLWWLATRVRRLAALVQAYAQELDGATAELDGLQSQAQLVIDVLNPLALAREQSRYAGKLIAVAPELIRKRVYQIVASELQSELAGRGVEAEVTIRKSS